MKKYQSNYVVQFKLGLLIVCIMMVAGSVNECKGQDRAVMKNDTIYYQGVKLYVNQPLRLGYGSSSTKDFAFVYMTNTSYQIPLQAGFAKQDLLVDNFKSLNNKLWIKCKVVGAKAAMGARIMFEVESAIDNKEVVL